MWLPRLRHSCSLDLASYAAARYAPVSAERWRSVDLSKGNKCLCVCRISTSLLSASTLTTSETVPPVNFVSPASLFPAVPGLAESSSHVQKQSKYGQDTKDSRPEMWLHEEEGGETKRCSEEPLAVTNSVDLILGGGMRICIGTSLCPCTDSQNPGNACGVV